MNGAAMMAAVLALSGSSGATNEYRLHAPLHSGATRPGFSRGMRALMGPDEGERRRLASKERAARASKRRETKAARRRNR